MQSYLQKFLTNYTHDMTGKRRTKNIKHYDIKLYHSYRHLGTLMLSSKRQSAWMSKITNDGLTQSGTGCCIAVPIWQQWASKYFIAHPPLLELLLSLVIIQFSLLLSLAHHKCRRNALHKFVSPTH